MAKLAWDAARHAQALERLLAERYDSHWGDHPVSLADWNDRLSDGRRPGGAPQPSR
jgi:hypothetical protein